MAEQTPPELPELEEDPSTLDLAKRAMAVADGLVAKAQRDPLAAVINQSAQYQRAYLIHAAALGTVATAEALERIEVLLGRLMSLLEERIQ